MNTDSRRSRAEGISETPTEGDPDVDLEVRGEPCLTEKAVVVGAQREADVFVQQPIEAQTGP